MKPGLLVTRIRLMEFMNRKIDRNGLLREVILSTKMAISPLLLLKKIRKSGTIRRQCFEISKPSYCIILFS